jgi:hypothetical protein
MSVSPQLVKKFPAFYGERKFITAFTYLPSRPSIRQTANYSLIYHGRAKWITLAYLTCLHRKKTPGHFLRRSRVVIEGFHRGGIEFLTEYGIAQEVASVCNACKWDSIHEVDQIAGSKLSHSCAAWGNLSSTWNCNLSTVQDMGLEPAARRLVLCGLRLHL